MYTTHGEVDEARLVRCDGALDNATETTTWQEYYLDGELVRRDLQMTLKAPRVSWWTRWTLMLGRWMAALWTTRNDVAVLADSPVTPPKEP